MKIIHISDLHLNSFYRNSHLEEINYILGYIANEKFDHLVITGDLTDNADPGDFEILRDLFKKYNFLNGDRLSLMIGNHDVYGGITTPDDIFTFNDKCQNINHHLRFNEFYLYFFEAFENCVYRKDYFPFAKLFGEVLIVAVNSVMEYSKVKNPFASNGMVSLDEFKELNKILDNYSFAGRKIIITHHHFNKIQSIKTGGLQDVWRNIEKQTLKLKKKQRLFNLFNKHNIDIVLHGHYHKSEEYYRKGLRFLNAGATIKDNTRKSVQINFLEINKEKLTVEIRKIDLRREQTFKHAAVRSIRNSPDSELILY